METNDQKGEVTRDQKIAPEFRENDHRSPSNRAQGHAYRQNACGVISLTSRQQIRRKILTNIENVLSTNLNALLSMKQYQITSRKRIIRTNVKIRISAPLGNNGRCGLSFHTANNVERLEALCGKSHALNTGFPASVPRTTRGRLRRAPLSLWL